MPRTQLGQPHPLPRTSISAEPRGPTQGPPDCSSPPSITIEGL